MDSDTNEPVAETSTCLTANVWKHGVRYQVGTPIELLPEKVLRGLTPASVDGPLPFDPPESAPAPRRRPRAKG